MREEGMFLNTKEWLEAEIVKAEQDLQFLELELKNVKARYKEAQEVVKCKQGLIRGLKQHLEYEESRTEQVNFNFKEKKT
jgi:hypothetical protein